MGALHTDQRQSQLLLRFANYRALVFLGLSKKDPKQHINNGRSHMMKILLTHPQGSVVLSLRENYSGAKDKSKITHLLLLVRRSMDTART